MKTENPTTLPATEVNPRPRRRNHTNKYKLTILERVDRCEANGERVGEVLRKEGLYSSQLATWRRQRREGTLGALGRKRGPKPSKSSEQLENEKLQREVARLQKRLAHAEKIIDVQKKLSEVLGLTLEEPPPLDEDS